MQRPLWVNVAVGSGMRDKRGVAWFVYLARCADDTLYCGITNDVPART